MYSDFEYWGKKYSNYMGYFGGHGVEPNNLVYIYDFATNSWSKFTQLDDQYINKYTCTTYISKVGKRYMNLITINLI